MFRALFGDESVDYGLSLQRYHANGPAPHWEESFVSAYATAHPWEDFAETFAHYLHIVDTLETANAFEIRVRPKHWTGAERPSAVTVDFDPYETPDFQRVVEAWIPLTYAVNSLNRSMGQPPLYPFTLTPAVIAKLAYVHERIYAARLPAGWRSRAPRCSRRSSPACASAWPRRRFEGFSHTHRHSGAPKANPESTTGRNGSTSTGLPASRVDSGFRCAARNDGAR